MQAGDVCVLTGHGGMLQPQRMSCCLLNIAYRSAAIVCENSAIPIPLLGRPIGIVAFRGPYSILNMLVSKD